MSVRAVACPACWKTLYRLVKSSSGTVSVDGPALETDAKGTYMVCAHCAGRIAVDLDETAAAAKIKIAPNQHAGRGYLPFIE
jgi:DNA-directed RNA polymerase subunit RPC12/RpoP